jgi:hypothetical protein
MERTKGAASILPAGAILIARLIVNKKGSFRHPCIQFGAWLIARVVVTSSLV